MDILQSKLGDIEQEAKLLSDAVPAQSHHVNTLFVELSELLKELTFAVEECREKLTETLDLNQFLSEFKNIR